MESPANRRLGRVRPCARPLHDFQRLQILQSGSGGQRYGVVAPGSCWARIVLARASIPAAWVPPWSSATNRRNSPRSRPDEDAPFPRLSLRSLVIGDRAPPPADSCLGRAFQNASRADRGSWLARMLRGRFFQVPKRRRNRRPAPHPPPRFPRLFLPGAIRHESFQTRAPSLFFGCGSKLKSGLQKLPGRLYIGRRRYHRRSPGAGSSPSDRRPYRLSL